MACVTQGGHRVTFCFREMSLARGLSAPQFSGSDFTLVDINHFIPGIADIVCQRE